jgi:hypothetical protein
MITQQFNRQYKSIRHNQYFRFGNLRKGGIQHRGKFVQGIDRKFDHIERFHGG